MENNAIAINFFSLTHQEFKFDIFRRKYQTGETKDTFPTCSRRKLPIAGELGYSDYWVSLEKVQDFELFKCSANDNPYITKEIIFDKLLAKCKSNLLDVDYRVDVGFRDRIIFTLAKFEEGFQGVWMEPYYLKSRKKTGFLVDFKFYRSPEAKFSRKIQQLSLSLDRSWKSNVNYYAERYEMLQRFISKYFPAIADLEINGYDLSIESKLQNLDFENLKPKKYILGNNKVNNSQFMGIKTFGPYQKILKPTKLCFVYREQDRSYSQDLYRALRGDTFSNTFPGMEKMFGYVLNNKSVVGKSVYDFSPNSLSNAIVSMKADAGDNDVLPVVVTPFSAHDEDVESDNQYYIAKHTFLKNHMPSQFVSLKKIEEKDQLKWAISNIGLQVFAKMGGTPWIVSPETTNCLIVGLGQAHKKNGKTIEKYFAYSVLTESTGLYKALRVLGHSDNRNNYMIKFRENLRSIFTEYIDVYDNFVVHVPFSIRNDELDIVQDILTNLNENQDLAQKKFVVIRFNDDNKFFGYSRNTNSMIPYESSLVQLSYTEYLVWFEGLQYQNTTIRKKIERPLYVDFLYPTNLTDSEKKNHLQDALNMSGANWRGFNAKSLPVSVYYAYLVAKYYKEFQSLNLEDVDLEKIRPWFL